MQCFWSVVFVVNAFFQIRKRNRKKLGNQCFPSAILLNRKDLTIVLKLMKLKPPSTNTWKNYPSLNFIFFYFSTGQQIVPLVSSELDFQGQSNLMWHI